MKSLLKVSLLLGALALGGCAKETLRENTDPASKDTRLVSFRAVVAEDYAEASGIDANGSGKAVVDLSDGKVAFEEGDRVTVSNGARLSEYVYDAASGLFTSEDPLEAASSYTAFYPASACTGKDGDALTLNLPATQSYSASTVLQAPMGAVSDGDVFPFHNLCTILEFRPEATEALLNVEFSAAEGAVSGAARFDGSRLSLTEAASGNLSLTLPAGFVPDGVKPVCLVIPARLYSGGFSLKATFASGKVWYQSLPRDYVFVAGRIDAMTPFTLTHFSGGRGSAADPWRIASTADLAELATLVAATDADRLHFRSDCYRQMADINFSGATMASIGNSNDGDGCYFEGSYQGGGHKVSNVVIANPNTAKAQGFFGYLSGAAHVDGLRLENVSVSASTWNVGTIVGCIQPGSTAVVENCVVTGGSVSANNTGIGGIVGKQMSGTVRRCSYAGTVTGTGSAKHQCGGIVGQVSNAGCLVDGCQFDGTVTGACGNVGGIVGSLAGGATVIGSGVSAASVIEGGSIADNGINIGGIVGYINNATGGKVENCTFAGEVKAHYYDVGGIVGRDQGVPIRACTFSGKVTSDYDDASASDELFSRLGGICGHLHGTGTVENCTVSGVVGSSTRYVGGVVGWLELGSVTDCRVLGLTVRGVSHVGGVAGRFKSGIVKSCTVTSTAVSATGNYAGGVAGSLVPGASLTTCSVSGGSVSSGSMCSGGIAGVFDKGGYIGQCSVSGVTVSAGTKLAGGILGNIDAATDARQSRIERCTVNGGSVSAVTGLLGGVLGGCNTYGIVDRCSASCNVSNTGTGAYGSVGGIVGWVNTPNLLIANSCYCSGSISNDNGTSGGVGGIVGQLYASTLGSTAVFNCCAFPTRISTGSGNANIAGIAGLVNTTTVCNCYSPVPASSLYFNGSASGTSRGSIYGWLRGVNTSDACSGVLRDVYWLEGFKAGNFNGNYKYEKSEQSLTDAQMRGTGAVSRPSNATAYTGFVAALNAAVTTWNASPVFDVRGVDWVMGTNGYPVPEGTALAGSSPAGSKKKVSLLGDSITTYKGYTCYPGNGQYPNGNYADFTSVTQTYWYQLIYNKMSNATLEVNSAFTGTCVQNTTSKGHPGYGFLQRYVDLGHPDVILINGGTNDAWSYALPVGSLDFSLETEALDTYQFAQAYDKLIRLIRAKYPSAQVCCIIGDNVMDASKTAYAQVIRDVCGHYGLPYAEVVFADRAASTYDKVHPNVAGMADMATQIWNALRSYL